MSAVFTKTFQGQLFLSLLVWHIIVVYVCVCVRSNLR